MENMQRMLKYFDEWSNKVECEMMQIMMQDPAMIRKLMEKRTQ